MELESSFVCVYCFQVNETMVDTTAGMRQEYVEDCQVCCRPNLLTIAIDPDLENADVTASIP